MSKYFNDSGTIDQWGDFSKIDPILITKLDKLREFLKEPIYVTSGYRPGNRSSQHFLGRAVDVVLQTDSKYSLLDFYLASERFGFAGIGVYGHWKNFDGVMVGGLHLDVRSGISVGRWIGVLNDKGAQEYKALNEVNLRLVGAIK